MKNLLYSMLCLTIFSTQLNCHTYSLLSLADQQSIREQYPSKKLYLKYSFFAGPFFEYNDRLLISERDFDERILIQSPSGEAILPLRPQALLPLGTQVEVIDILFPTQQEIAKRKLHSPRHFTWVLLRCQIAGFTKPLVLVLTQQFKNTTQFHKALNLYLVEENPRERFADLDPRFIQAIDHKTLVKDMTIAALLRSRGHPDHVIRKTVDGVRIEHWQYKQNRVVEVRDDRVYSWTGFEFYAFQRNPVTPK